MDEVNVVMPVPLLRLCFLRVVEGVPETALNQLAEKGKHVTEDELMGVAQWVRQESAEECFFCMTPNHHKTGWKDKPWTELANELCPCLTQYMGTRRTHYPSWEKNIPNIVQRVHAGTLPATAPLYTDLCTECKKPFTVTAQNAVVGGATTKKVVGWTRCYACAAKYRHKRAKQVIATPVAPGVPTIAVRRAPRVAPDTTKLLAEQQELLRQKKGAV